MPYIAHNFTSLPSELLHKVHMKECSDHVLASNHVQKPSHTEEHYNSKLHVNSRPLHTPQFSHTHPAGPHSATSACDSPLETDCSHKKRRQSSQVTWEGRLLVMVVPLDKHTSGTTKRMHILRLYLHSHSLHPGPLLPTLHKKIIRTSTILPSLFNLPLCPSHRGTLRSPISACRLQTVQLAPHSHCMYSEQQPQGWAFCLLIQIHLLVHSQATLHEQS